MSIEQFDDFETLRITNVYRKINGKWLIVHEHSSCPVDLTTGQADLSSE
ncbi:MAG TPA: nuclear transport factor 2 family protein [Blastocatellia bacterium]|nr:nuclear transport factor 2 family protein [Blastocatellia bacterium]